MFIDRERNGGLSMEITTANIIQIAVYLVTLGVFIGVTKQQFSNLENQLKAQKEQLTIQIAALERKVEKHNNLIERMYKCEESLKSAHKRIDGLERKG